MDVDTIHKLNAINKQFYAITATDFDATRGTPWPGWETLLTHLPMTPLSVLDVGCGNGRFGLFLAETRTIQYTGLDNNAQLLAYAETALNDAGVSATLAERDVVAAPPDAGTYDLVVAFGLLHHVPGADNRTQFIATLAERVAPGGFLAVAFWRFYEFERFQRRIVPWSEAPDIDSVEQHDYLLDWRRGERALRYCHFVDDAEQAHLEAATGLQSVARYRADGFTGTVNSYSLLQRV